MKCIQYQFHILAVSSQYQLKDSRAAKLHWFSTPAPIFLKNQNLCSSPRTQAISNSLLVLGITTASPPNVSVFIGTSAVFFFMFWIANFVVPGMIIKNLGTEESKEDKDRDLDVGNGGYGKNEKP